MDKIKKIVIALILFVVVILIVGIINPFNGEQILGGGYSYDIEGKRVFGPDIDIPPCAKIIKYRGDVIIVEQHPKRMKEEATYGREYNYPNGRDTTYYWVVYKKEHMFYGPLLRNQLDSILTSERIKTNGK